MAYHVLLLIKNCKKMSPIPQEHNWRYFFHMTDVHNLESILKNGLLSTNLKESKGITHTNIANMTIQERRSKMDVTCGKGGKVHDYVPFYFSSMNPMLLGVLNTKNQDQQFIIYICLKIEKIIKLNGVFTDASANTSESPNFYDDVKDLDKLSWDLIDNSKWSQAEATHRHRKMAEVLIKDKVDASDIDSIVVFNDWIKEGVKELLDQTGLTHIKICYGNSLVPYKYYFYYTKYFIPGHKNDSIITGPYFLKLFYQKCIESISKRRLKATKKRPFANVEDLVAAINNQFDCIRELAGIYGLETENVMHTETVSSHSQIVADNIKKTTYYQSCNAHDKSLLELAAFLHDIGKGPKEKWETGKQSFYPDHPADSLPMMERILVEEIESISEEDIRVLVMLVAYHDIVGGCMFENRNIQEIKGIAVKDGDVDKLICIAEADIQAINGSWYNSFIKEKSSFKQSI